MAREGTGRVKERRRRREGKSFEFPVANKEWQTQAVCAFREGREVSTLPPPLSPFVPCSLSKPLLSSLFPPPATERARAEWRPALLLGKLVFVSPPPPTPLSNYVGGFLTQSSISPPPSPPRHRRPPLSISLAVKIASLFSPFSQRSHNPQFRSLFACFRGVWRKRVRQSGRAKGDCREELRGIFYPILPLFSLPHIPISPYPHQTSERHLANTSGAIAADDDDDEEDPLFPPSFWEQKFIAGEPPRKGGLPKKDRSNTTRVCV